MALRREKATGGGFALDGVQRRLDQPPLLLEREEHRIPEAVGVVAAFELCDDEEPAVAHELSLAEDGAVPGAIVAALLRAVAPRPR